MKIVITNDSRQFPNSEQNEQKSSFITNFIFNCRIKIKLRFMYRKMCRADCYRLLFFSISIWLIALSVLSNVMKANPRMTRSVPHHQRIDRCSSNIRFPITACGCDKWNIYSFVLNMENGRMQRQTHRAAIIGGGAGYSGHQRATFLMHCLDETGAHEDIANNHCGQTCNRWQPIWSVCILKYVFFLLLLSSLYLLVLLIIFSDLWLFAFCRHLIPSKRSNWIFSFDISESESKLILAPSRHRHL